MWTVFSWIIASVAVLSIVFLLAIVVNLNDQRRKAVDLNVQYEEHFRLWGRARDLYEGITVAIANRNYVQAVDLINRYQDKYCQNDQDQFPGDFARLRVATIAILEGVKLSDARFLRHHELNMLVKEYELLDRAEIEPESEA